MRTGRPRKPVEVHRAQGTHRRHRHGDTPTVVGGRGVPDPPGHLPAGVQEAFRELVAPMAESGVLDLVDAPLIESAATCLWTAREARRDITERGQLIEVRRVGADKSELIRTEPNPSLRIERDAWQEFRQLSDRLGIGPSARARLAGFGIQGREADEQFDELAELRKARSA